MSRGAPSAGLSDRALRPLRREPEPPRWLSEADLRRAAAERAEAARRLVHFKLFVAGMVAGMSGATAVCLLTFHFLLGG